jgi:HEAT repeat protein
MEALDLTPELTAAYQRLAADPFELDKGCLAMKAILGALFAHEADAEHVYLHAIHHIQFDSGTFSADPIDSAAELRGVAAHVLVKTGHPRALEEIAPLLLDATSVRVAAVRALRAASSYPATLLLRMKLLMGEHDPEVCFECFAGLLDYSHDSMSYVASFLEHDDPAVASMAALAIGESRGEDAFEALKGAWYGQTNPDVRDAVLNAIASLRSNEAIDFLVELVSGETVSALMALDVLTRFKADSNLVARIREVAAANKRPAVLSAFRVAFG